MLAADSSARGVSTALRYYGLEKTAFLKQILVGRPGAYLDQARSGRLFSRDGLIAESLDPRVTSGPEWLRKPATAMSAAAMYGLPLYSLYETAKAPAESRGSAVGSTAGAILGSTLGAPLGLAGTTAGQFLGSSLGERVGSMFNASRAGAPRRNPDPDAVPG